MGIPDLTHTSARTPNLLSTPSFLSRALSFSLNHLGPPGLLLSGSFTPQSQHGGRVGDVSSPRPPSSRISYSTPNIFIGQNLERKLDFHLSLRLGLLNLGLELPNKFKDPFHEELKSFSPGPGSPSLRHRLSIWSTPYKDDGPFSSYNAETLYMPLVITRPHHEQLDILPRTKNIYTSKLHSPVFVPGEDTPTTSTSEDNLIDPLVPLKEKFARVVNEGFPDSKEKQHTENDASKQTYNTDTKEEFLNIVVKFSGVQLDDWSLPQENGDTLSKVCSKHLLNGLRTKTYPEDFCSTFYKRNKHGYMFIRESSSSLKVNSSGLKSWVTMKLKLGKHEAQKIKVDVKKLPVWKPINLNQTSVSRKSGKRDHRKKLAEGTNHSRKSQVVAK